MSGARYTGDVRPGGPSDVLRLPGAVVRKASVSAMANNAYLVTDLATGASLLVDAADDAPRMLSLLTEAVPDGGSGTLAQVVTTHAHWDHHRALAAVVAATGAGTAAGRLDAGQLPVQPDDLLDHGDAVRVGALELEVVHLRGHTPGSVALVLRTGDGATHLFSGDSLFQGGPGRTTSPQDFDTLMADLQARIFDRLPDDTRVLPGHGADTTLGAERASIPGWLARRW